MTNVKVIGAVIVAMIYTSYIYSESLHDFVSKFVPCFVLGFSVMWTYLEYFQHRFILHQELNLDPNEPWTEAAGVRNGDNFGRHIHHHVFMNQKNRIVLSLSLYFQYIAVVTPLFALVLSPQIEFSLGAGWLFGSLFYDYMHMAFHFPKEYGDFQWSWFQKMKSAHMRHHFRDNSREFGVTTDLWDIVHGTKKHDK